MVITQRKLNNLNTHLVGILRTKPSTPAINAITAIQSAFDAGIEAVEVTSNSDHWQEVVNECVKRDLNIGVGSVKSKQLAKEAINHGAKFLVSPGFFKDVIEVTNKNNIPILTGVFTEEDLKQAVDLGVPDVKFFPSNVSTHEELLKAIHEPFRDEFDELIKLSWEIIPFSSLTTYHLPLTTFVKSPTQFYKLYLEAVSHQPSAISFKKIVIELPDDKKSFERLSNFITEASKHSIRTYAVGGVNDKNMKEVLTKYGAYGVCPGSGMFNSDAIFKGDYERVRADVKRYVEIIKELFTKVN